MQFSFDGYCTFNVPPQLRITKIQSSASGGVTVDADVVIPPDCKLTCAEVYCLEQGQKIRAIKAVRERTGLGLKEAKDLCDNYHAPAPY